MAKAIRTLALILLLACHAQAGIMGNGSPEPPPPSSSTSTVQEPTADGMTTGETNAGETSVDMADTLTQAALELLAVLPSLL